MQKLLLFKPFILHKEKHFFSMKISWVPISVLENSDDWIEIGVLENNETYIEISVL